MFSFPQTSLALCAVALLTQPLALAQQAAPQQLIPANLPACAQTCALLVQTAQSCQTTPATAATCFCQAGASGALAAITTTDTNLCTGFCSDADFGTIRTWYRQYCANPNNPGGGQTTAPAQGGGGQATPTPTEGGAPPPAATTSRTPSYLDSGAVDRNESGSEWWSNHWQWVLMVIILVIGFTAIGVGGSIWYKRRKRRIEGWDEPRPDMSQWAPSHQSVHDIGNNNAAGTAGAAAVPASHHSRKGRKGKQRVSEAPAAARSPPPPSAGKRLSKALGRG